MVEVSDSITTLVMFANTTVNYCISSMFRFDILSVSASRLSMLTSNPILLCFALFLDLPNVILVWKVKFVGKVSDSNGKEKLIRIMDTPSLFVLEQDL